jgi:uncharacterized Fe-S cluster-containing radical SAM superfamily protein
MVLMASEGDSKTGPEPRGAPVVELQSLDELWFQVGGTLCNLSCHHCFISCHPANDAFGFLRLESVRRYLDEAVELGVKELYFTGGEPFLNRDLVPILEETLAIGPATVLTNGTIHHDGMLSELERLAGASRYSLEIRVSIDGPDAATNDPIRGEGTFEKAMEGVVRLARHGFLPIVTMAQTWPDEKTPDVLGGLTAVLKARSCPRPRVKILPALRLGMEAVRSRPYLDVERVTREMLLGYDVSRLLCHHSRTVTDRGVAVCPIIIEAPGSHLGATLAEASRPFAITHGACYTCWVHGAICSNASASVRATDR